MHGDSKAIGWRFAMAAALVLSIAGPAHAVDGVIEINQARALAGGVTPGDEPGFPVTISQPGSYRLTGNMAVPDANTTAITITTDNVTIDLNGFAILGPAVCSGTPTTCSASGTSFLGIGIKGFSGITVRNGTVRGLGAGLILTRGARVHGVHVLSNMGVGVIVGADSTVRGNTVNQNGSHGIFAGAGSTVGGNTVNNNGSEGVRVDAPCTVNGNMVRRNQGRGIDIVRGQGSGSTVIGNTASDNGSLALFSEDPSTGYVNNVFTENNGGNAQVSGGIQMGPNICGPALCP